MSKNKKTLIRIVVALIVSVITLILKYTIDLNEWIQLGLFAAAYIVAGYDVLLKAVTNIFHGKVFDEHFLMTIATIGAFAIGEYADAAAVMILYQIGELFQRYAVGKSRKNIASLMDIRPEEARVLRNGEEISVHPSEIEVGEIFVVKAGDKIALDGIIQKGECNVDTSAITGESLPRKVSEGQTVLSGCINLDGVIYVTATGTYDDSTVAKILDLVENATSSKAPAENFITKFSKYYTPIVVGLAVLLGVLPPLVTAQFTDLSVWSTWLKRAMMFLFVSCPCALVISVPLGFFGGIAAASKRGILVKGSNYLELLAKVNTIAFDKTGTLTKGNFAVTEVYPKDNSKQVLELAAIAEQYSNHPIAISINKHAKAKCEAKVTEIAGKGLQAQTDYSTILCGNSQLMTDNGIEHPQASGGTVVYVAEKQNGDETGKFVGYIVIADEIKSDAEIAVRQLQQSGCKTVMLTGDNASTAKTVAQKLAIDSYFAELLPQDKVTKLNELKGKNTTVAFVGDGINDAPVLATADVGIAMGGMGSDVAIETADVVLMQDNPTAISTAKRIAKKTLNIVRENIIISLLIKFAVLVLSAVGVLDLVSFGLIIAILADVGVCVVAILNSMRAMLVSKK
ncbi:MAG: cadmium-translocating P-type ATPase [Clostridiales bacterium]|nr:cadmium-translocating P-type ATPase [Clostridiales bacterium]